MVDDLWLMTHGKYCERKYMQVVGIITEKSDFSPE